MTHDHSHNNGVDLNKAFIFGIILNSGYIVIETIYGLIINSMALLADAGHNVSDVLGLLLTWGASYLVLKKPTVNRTYGFRKSSILAALLNAILLLVAVGAIGFESIRKFIHPEPVEGITIMIVAGIGVIINSATALLFIRSKNKDLNIKGAFLHMVADAAVSFGVVIGGIVIFYTKSYWIDPVISLIIMVVILFGTWNLLKDSLNLALDSVPVNINPHEVESYLHSLQSVKEFHDLHIWAMSTTENALTVHIVKKDSIIDDELTTNISEYLHHHFGIDHTTIQYESGKTDLNCLNNSV